MTLDRRKKLVADQDPAETREWIESIDSVVQYAGKERAHYLLRQVHEHLQVDGVRLPYLVHSPYLNTIPVSQQPDYPGDFAMEKRVRRIIRWNAAVMVHRANMNYPGLGGHLSTYASAAMLYEVGFHHFFRSPSHPAGGDQVFFQGHSSPGIYARAFLEGRMTEAQLEAFRRESVPGTGISSYPHPRLMPDFWQFSTVSMGLGAISAIYQARFNRYLMHRGIKDTRNCRVWAFLGDGETDEPESLGALSLAAREGLDNLVFVINCNLQRLDGPVRGNGKIIQELESVFQGAGWNVIKVVWGSSWDPLLAEDHDGILRQRFEEVVDGEYQKYVTSDLNYVREHFFGKYPQLKQVSDRLSDKDLRRMYRGGHDPVKVYAGYEAATRGTVGRLSYCARRSRATPWATASRRETTPTSRRNSARRS
jgi:pyruvate dehydrogenase E1 component